MTIIFLGAAVFSKKRLRFPCRGRVQDALDRDIVEQVFNASVMACATTADLVEPALFCFVGGSPDL